MPAAKPPFPRARLWPIRGAMSGLSRLRLIGVLLAVVMGLGGAASPFAQRMATLDDLVIAQAMQAGAQASDFCGKDGKALLSGVTAQMAHAAEAALPPHCPAMSLLPRGAVAAALLPEPPLMARRTFDPGTGSRAPPVG